MENDNTKKPNPILRLVLSVICGGLIGFIVMLLGESIGLLITSAAAALLISVVAYGLSINNVCFWTVKISCKPHIYCI